MADTILHDGIEFRQVPEYPGYAVSRCGKVVSCKIPGCHSGRRGPWRRLSCCLSRYGYVRLGLCRGGNVTHVEVHRLVLEAWVGPCPDGMECCHGDGDPTNNCLENIRWATHQDNVDDTNRHGTQARGERQGSAKLTEADIPLIRSLLQSGKTQRAIARQFGVSARAIGKISSGTTWSHI